MPLFIMNSDDKYLAAAAHNEFEILYPDSIVKRISQRTKAGLSLTFVINPVSAYALDSHR